VLIDTAGIGETDDPVERLGVARSRAALAAADLALLVLDASVPPTPEDSEIAALVERKPTIVVLNKIDLVESKIEDRQSRNHPLSSILHPLSSEFAAVIATSALTGAGLEDLSQAVARVLLGGAPINGERMVSNPRHRDALGRAVGHVRDAIGGYARHVPADLLAVDLTAALTAIGEITGEGVHDDLLAAIFSRFCIGK
jgi:tRNA modification GTPase